MTTSTIERKIKGLLAQAADREGTPEGDAFRDKAFSLMAQYGVEQATLPNADADDIANTAISLSGCYTDMQAILLAAISQALHCRSLSWKQRGSTRVSRTIVYGRRCHLDRVTMLFSLLNPQMITGAANGLFTK